jgi:hypothetical protein
MILEKAAAFFGEDGLGLELVERDPCCASFKGGGGHVSLTVSEGERRTEVELETREWDYQVRQFINEIG